MALRWIKDAKSTGLASIGAKPRGATLIDTKLERAYMFVSAENASGGRWARDYDAWRFWVVGAGQTPNRRSKNSWPTFEEAKAHAVKYWDVNKEVMIKAKDAWEVELAAKKEAEKASEVEQARKVGGVDTSAKTKQDILKARGDELANRPPKGLG